MHGVNVLPRRVESEEDQRRPVVLPEPRREDDHLGTADGSRWFEEEKLEWYVFPTMEGSKIAASSRSRWGEARPATASGVEKKRHLSSTMSRTVSSTVSSTVSIRFARFA